MSEARIPVPRLVWRMRSACKDYPLNAQLLKDAANRVCLTNLSLGIQRIPARWPQTGAYAKAARVFKQVTGKHWYGEEQGTTRPQPAQGFITG